MNICSITKNQSTDGAGRGELDGRGGDGSRGGAAPRGVDPAII